MKKKVLSILMLLTMLMVFGSQLVAAETIATPYSTSSDTVWTSGGTNGKVQITFRVACYQNSSDNTIFSWTSSMTPQSGVTMSTYSQSGEVTYSDYSKKAFTSSNATYSYSIKKAMNGGYSNMSASASSFGSASKRLYTTASLN